MFRFHWLSRLTQRWSHGRASVRRAPTRPVAPALEALEDRLALSTAPVMAPPAVMPINLAALNNNVQALERTLLAEIKQIDTQIIALGQSFQAALPTLPNQTSALVHNLTALEQQIEHRIDGLSHQDLAAILRALPRR